MGTLEGHNDTVWGLALLDTTLYSGSVDETIKVWDLATGVCQHTLDAGEAVYALCLCAARLVSAGDCVQIWNTTNHTRERVIDTEDSVVALAMDEQHQIMVSQTHDGDFT